jgi:hypothetical protein
MGWCGTLCSNGLRTILGALPAVVLLAASPLRAAPSTSDGVYGRLDGDVGLEPAVGVEYSRHSLLPEVDLSATYVSTLGLRLRHADSRPLMQSVAHDRSVSSVDFELRPLFLARWSQVLESGPALLDLTLDSFMLGIGAFWDYDRNTNELRRGSELITGIGVPLLAKSSGPWLRLSAALRISEGPGLMMVNYSAYGVTLSWNLFVNSGIHDDTR